MENITQLILKKLNKSHNYLVKKKHGKSPEILLGDLIFAIIEFNSGADSRAKLGLSERTFNRVIKAAFPGIKLSGGGQTWSHYLLTLVGYKRCFKCNSIKLLADFLSEGGCKDCRHKYNTSEARRCINRLHQQNFYKDHKYYFRQKRAKYRAVKLQALPKWADTAAITQFYRSCPEGYHVDHIIPLQGKYVCGLHVLNNLQYLSISDNCSKGNYHISEEYWR